MLFVATLFMPQAFQAAEIAPAHQMVVSAAVTLGSGQIRFLSTLEGGRSVRRAPDGGADSAEGWIAQASRQGLASWYGGGERLNMRGAMGLRFNPAALEAAMWDVPFGSMVKVTNLDNGSFVIVRITDRGPARRFERRIIDLTRRAFARLAPLREGLIPVLLEPL